MPNPSRCQRLGRAESRSRIHALEEQASAAQGDGGEIFDSRRRGSTALLQFAVRLSHCQDDAGDGLDLSVVVNVVR
jgi:hypothetical protein